MYCEKCGAEILDESKGCEKCGKNIDQQKKKDYAWILVLLFIVGMLAFFIWAILTNPYSPIALKPNIQVDDTSGSQGIGYSDVSFQIYNSGNLKASNVYAKIDIVTADSEKVIASKTIFIGSLNPGDSRSMKTRVEHTNSNNLKFRVIPQY